MGLRHGNGGDEVAPASDGAGPKLPERLPPELAFLPTGVVQPALLRRAAETARRLRLSPEQVVLAEGWVSAEAYCRALARHLGVPVAERPLRPSADATVEAVLRLGLLRLAPNRDGWAMLAAPRGPLLRRLLAFRAADRSIAGLALTTPERLEALIRQEHRGAVARAASHGLSEWNEDLSARSGLTVRQRLWLAAAAVLLAGLAVGVPGACAELLALVFSAGFLLAVGVRLAATAASPPPRDPARPPLPEPADLPTYSVVVPLFREAGEVRRLTAALDRLRYPVLGSKHT